ncbi:ECF transporter S component [Virgibacillus siamensis]|uniref:ECF transporter S component n=1 Tax=Virgibacillus siamensis TaxID=480071 RepID=UPI00098725FF|nr:ECF transporter S component [Virgibacillus siamensis]
MAKTWKLKEIVLMSVLSVVCGVVYMMFSLLGQGMRNILLPFGLAPFGFEIIFGIWFIVSIITAYIIRKPGAALISEVVAAGVEILAGAPGGASTLLTGLIQGAAAEVPFALTKWHDYRLRILMLAGMSAAVFSFIWNLYSSGYIALSLWLLVSMLVVRLISGALLAGMLGKWVSDSLAKTGVLSGYALGKELKKKRENGAA